MFIKNRVGRIVEVPEELGRAMIKDDGAVLYEPEIVDSGLKDISNGQAPENKNPLECPYCGKVCGNKVGFKSHTEACKKKALSSQS